MLKLTARSRVNLMFVVGLALLITAGFVTYSTFLKQANDSDWVSHTYRNLNQLEKSRDLIQKMQVAQRDHRLNKENTHALSDFSAARTEIESNLKTLNQLMADNPAQVMRLATVEDQLKQLYTFWTLPENAIHSIQTVNRESNQINAVRTNLDHLVTVEQNLLTNRENQRESAFRTAGTTILVAMTLAILIATLLILVVFRELKQREQAQLELNSRLNDLSQLNEETAQKNWLLTGVSKINDSLQATHDLDSLAQCIVKEVVAYLEIPAGALYVLNEQSLIQKAAVGLPLHTPTEWPLGSGLLGKAAASKHLQRIQNVPPQFWQLQSSTGASLPGEVLFLPLWNGSNLKGILELASFGTFSASSLLLLETAGDNIAVALDASMTQAFNGKLLSQVQLQADTLLEQQETLKQANEELTRQAEVLQASEEELKVQEEELRQINVELEERNEAIESTRQALTIKARELEQSSQYKSEFLANMSHELRTPLNSVLILARLLADNKSGNLTEKQIEHAQVIFRSGTDLLNLINDILDLSKIEAGKIDILVEEVKTARILRNMQDLFSVLADDKGINFRITTGDLAPDSFFSDYQRIEQILKNLLSNAFKFTPRGGSIQLDVQLIQPQPEFFSQKLSEAREVLAFSVEDSGIGIPLEKQQLIFEAFQQADGSTNRKFGGTGLGLSICRELSRLLGGEIRVNSETGRGSTFTLYLPAQGMIMPKDRTRTVVAETKPALFSLEKPQEQTQVTDDRQDLVQGDHPLLIIEDDAVYAERLRDLSQARGYKTVVALTGAEGLYYAQTYRPSAILLDIFLPDTDGWSLLKSLKNDPVLQSIPVHIISAGDEPRHNLQGAVSFLNKAASREDFEAIFARIAEHLPSSEKKSWY
ncbi:histidine kinase [Siphonobacter sp. BAB-5385]|uniref:ATP-binding protein n=1 Tax=Siphonobacter sp. BAB-5385 TaxID=1864822 RepID=UPI000B9E69E6|nr:ATP-binding protein [Siphonobacter sp. BAB-5385]OZI06412.1 histidine kinase [Siphonobacter sp. BAB-5385]